MNQKTKGIFVSVGTLVLLVIVTLIVSIILAALSDDPWVGLGTATVLLIISGIIMVMLLIFGIVKYSKHKSQFGLGIIYGIVGLIVVGISFSIFTAFYNMII